MHIITEKPMKAEQLYEKIRKENSGSVIFHYAVVKNQAAKKKTAGIRFERAGDMESELSQIEADIRNRWKINDVMLARRLGHLQVGDLISLVAVSAEGSADAFDACRYGLDRIRKMTSIKKNELFLD